MDGFTFMAWVFVYALLAGCVLETLILVALLVDKGRVLKAIRHSTLWSYKTAYQDPYYETSIAVYLSVFLPAFLMAIVSIPAALCWGALYAFFIMLRVVFIEPKIKEILKKGYPYADATAASDQNPG